MGEQPFLFLSMFDSEMSWDKYVHAVVLVDTVIDVLL